MPQSHKYRQSIPAHRNEIISALTLLPGKNPQPMPDKNHQRSRRGFENLRATDAHGKARGNLQARHQHVEQNPKLNAPGHQTRLVGKEHPSDPNSPKEAPI